MLPILMLMVLFVVGIIFITRFALWFAETLTGNLLNDNMRAAEFILEHHQAPEMWGRPDHKFYPAGKGRLLARLDKLIRYFEVCPFFEDEESRTLLLTQLRTERDDWNET
jgi:hypothetical protein